MVETVHVAGIDYSVCVRDKYHPEMFVDDELTAGNVHYQQQEINLSEETGEQVRYKILIHECMHAVLHHYPGRPEIFNEEGIVEGMAMHLFSFIRDNPALIYEIWEACGVIDSVYSGDETECDGAV